MMQLGLLYDVQGEPERGRPLHEESLILARELRDRSAIAYALALLAQEHLLLRDDLMTTHSQLEESLALYREVGDKPGMATNFYLLTRVALNQGDASTARRLAEESIAL